MAICSPERKKRFKKYPLRKPEKLYSLGYVWDDPTEVLTDPELDERGIPKRGNFHHIYQCVDREESQDGSLSIGMELLDRVASLKVDDHKAAVAFLNEFGPWGLQIRNVTYRHSDEAYDGRYRRTDDWWAEAVRAKRAIWLHKVLRESPEEAHSLVGTDMGRDRETVIVDWPSALFKDRFRDRLILSFDWWKGKYPSPEVMLWTYLAKMVSTGLLKSQHAETLHFDSEHGRIVRQHWAFMSIGSILWRLIADLVTEVHKDKICGYCGKPFQSNRRDARFCSSSCRAANHRGSKAQTSQDEDVAELDWQTDHSDAWENDFDGLGIDDIPF